MPPRMRSASVTTGLKWAPDTFPKARMSAISPKAVAIEFSSSCSPSSPGESRWAKIPEPTTMATSRPVPTASATTPRARALRSVISAARSPGRSRRRSLPGEIDEPAAEVLDRGGPQPVVGPVPEPLALHQTGVPEDPEVVAHERLRCIERLDQMADAELLVGQQPENPPPQRLGRRPEPVERCRRIYISFHSYRCYMSSGG